MYNPIKFKKSISTLFKSLITTSIPFVLLSCNAGVASNSTNSQLAPDSLSNSLTLVSSYSEFSKNDCIKGTFDSKGNLSLSNICSTPQSFSQAILKFVAQDNNGNGVAIDGLSYSDAYSFNVNTAGANVAVGTLSDVSKDLTLQPLQTIQFSASVNGNLQNGFNNLLANQTFEIDGIFNNSNTAIAPLTQSTSSNDTTASSNGPISKAALQATANTGTLKLNIDTKNAGCNKWADCSKVMVQINDSLGAAVDSVKLTSGSFGKTYSTSVDLPVGKYTITLSNVPNTTSQIDATTVDITNGKSVTSNITYNTTVGSVKVTVDTSKAGCTATSCKNLAINVVSVLNGISAGGFTVPESQIGKSSYNQQIDGIPAGNYQVVATPAANTVVTYSDNGGKVAVAADKTVSQKVTYTADANSGSAQISLGTLISGRQIQLPLTIINPANNNQVVYSGNIAQGGSVSVSGLDSRLNFNVCIPQGYADPALGKYFVQTACQSLKINKSKTTNLAINMVASSATMVQVNLQVSGLTAGDSAQTTFGDAANKYIYAPLSGVTNNKYPLTFEKSSTISLSTKALAASTVYTVNPLVYNATLNLPVTINQAFSTITIGASLDIATSYSYVNNTLINVPVGRFGLISYVVTNTSNEIESAMTFPSASSYPQDVTMDVTRTTCMCKTCSPVRSVASLNPGQSCIVVFKYQPTAYSTSGTFNYSMGFTGTTSKKTLATPIITIPYSSRSK